MGLVGVGVNCGKEERERGPQVETGLLQTFGNRGVLVYF